MGLHMLWRGLQLEAIFRYLQQSELGAPVAQVIKALDVTTHRFQQISNEVSDYRRPE